MNFTGISDCELLVMKCLWDSSQPISVRTLIVDLEKKFGKKYKETTVYTFLSNLRKKEYVDSYKKGASYFFATVKEEDFVRDFAGRMRDFWGEEVFAMFLDSAIYKNGSTESDRDFIKKLLQSNM